jgi:hypothetical protein
MSNLKSITDSLYFNAVFTFNHISTKFIFSSEKEDMILNNLKIQLTPYQYNDNTINAYPQSCDTWRIYLCTQISSELYSACIDSITDSQHDLSIKNEMSSSIMITCWKEKIRWHVLKKAKINNFIEDIYCGIRRIIMRKLSYLSSIQLHSACFSIKDKTIMLIGSKGTGKSSFEYYSMLKHNAFYLSSDRTFLFEATMNEIMCLGVPSSFRFNLKELEKYPNTVEHSKVKDLVTTKSEFMKQANDYKISVTPHEMCDIFKGKILNLAKPEVLIFLESNESTTFNVIENSIALKIVKKHIMSETHNDYPDYITENTNDNILELLCMKCKCYKLGGYPSFQEIDKIIDIVK